MKTGLDLGPIGLNCRGVNSPRDLRSIMLIAPPSELLRFRLRTNRLRGDPLMHILDIFDEHPATFSFEFFPPRTDAASVELFEVIAQLQALQPSFVSVTYGAGGSTRERTHDLIVRHPARDQPDRHLTPDLRLPLKGRA